MKYLLAILLILVLMLGWIVVQSLARRFAQQHPEMGPVKEEGMGCGINCNCKKGSCRKQANT